MKGNFEARLAPIEQLEQFTEQVNAMVEKLRIVGAKEEFYALEESANALASELESLDTPEKNGLIDSLTSAVIEADGRVSEGRGEIEGAMAEEDSMDDLAAAA